MSGLIDFHFLRPAWLLLLGVLPLLWWSWRRSRDDAGAWRAAVDAHLLPHLLAQGETRDGAGPWLAAALWALLVAALAGPAWDREPVPLYRNEAARVLALELAPSMLAQDVRPSRLERARYKLNDILTRSADMQTALIAYAGDAFVAAPLTDDVNTVRNLIDSLGPDTMPVAGNATARAIERAVDLIHQAGLAQGELVLLADGVGADALAAARDAHAQGLDISVLGVGETGGAPVPLPGGGFLKDASGNIVVPRLDESDLRALAAAGGGRYARLSADASDLDTLLTDHQRGTAAGEPAEDAAGGTRWRDRGPWLLLLALPLALAGFRRGWFMVLALVLLAPAPPAYAISFDDLWLRPDQQAARALAADDQKKAAEVAESPAWRGTAAYRGGDYARAAAAYAEAGKTADAAYNRGNALAKLGRYEDALAAYDEALELAPDMADAAANRQAVEDWLKQQEQQQQDHPQDPSGQPSGSQSPAGDAGDAGSGGEKDQPPADDAQRSAGDNPESPEGESQADAKPTGTENPDETSPPDGQRADEAGSNQASADDASGDSTNPQTQEPDSAQNAANPDDAGAQPSEEQQQALGRELDEQLANGEDPAQAGQAGEGQPGEDQSARAPSRAETARSEQQQALEQWLERVPDDPGGLLRRKFLLEYQQRQRNGDDGE